MITLPWLATLSRTTAAVLAGAGMSGLEWKSVCCIKKRLKWRTCGLIAVLMTSLIFTVMLVSEIFTSKSYRPQRHFITRDGLQRTQEIGFDSLRENIVFDPSKLINSNTIGPPCTSLLVIAITSAPANVKRREIIRKTWARRDTSNERYDWQYFFMIGRSENKTLSKTIRDEIATHNDILFGDYVDTYRNLTTKVLHGFAWVRSHCPSTKFVLKTDDDCYVNTVILPRLVQDYHAEDTRVYLGKVFTGRDLEVLREGPWSLSRTEYPKPEYPAYASGIGYLLSMDLLGSVLERSRYIKPFPVEDAYFGVVLSDLGAVPIHSGRFTFQSASWNLCNFLYILVVHHVSEQVQQKFHQMAIKAQQACHEPFRSKWN